MVTYTVVTCDTVLIIPLYELAGAHSSLCRSLQTLGPSFTQIDSRSSFRCFVHPHARGATHTLISKSHAQAEQARQPHPQAFCCACYHSWGVSGGVKVCGRDAGL